jgi:hypothetical protein
MARRICEHCGAEIPRRAAACPECGSDETTGWAGEDAIHDALWGVDEEDRDDAYEDVLRDLGLDSGHPGRAGPRSRRDLALLLIAAIVVFALLLALFP